MIFTANRITVDGTPLIECTVKAPITVSFIDPLAAFVKLLDERGLQRKLPDPNSYRVDIYSGSQVLFHWTVETTHYLFSCHGSAPLDGVHEKLDRLKAHIDAHCFNFTCDCCSETQKEARRDRWVAEVLADPLCPRHLTAESVRDFLPRPPMTSSNLP